MIIDSVILKESLERIASALGTDVDPISGHFLFRNHPSYCEILSGGDATGLCGYVQIKDLPPSDIPDGSVLEFTCNGNQLLGFLSAVNKGLLHILFDPKSMQVNIKPETSRTDFNTESLDPRSGFNFTDYDVAVKNGVKGTFDREDLETSVGFTKDFIGLNNSINPGFGLMCLAESGDGGLIKTGDGKSIAIFYQSNFHGQFKCRGEKLSSVMSFVKKSTGVISLLEGDSYYFLRDESGSYYGFKKVAFDFPETKGLDLFAETGTHILSINKNALKGALNRLKWSLEKDQYRMRFDLTPNSDEVNNTSLKLSTTTSTGKVSSETLGICRTIGNGDVEFYLNYKYLLQSLDKFTKEDVTFYLTLAKFNYVKLLERNDTATRVLFLNLMKKPG